MNEQVRLRMRRAHAKHARFCSCGRIVRGNGGKASHEDMHRRRGEWCNSDKKIAVPEHHWRDGELVVNRECVRYETSGHTWITAEDHRALFGGA